VKNRRLSESFHNQRSMWGTRLTATVQLVKGRALFFTVGVNQFGTSMPIPQSY